MAATGLGDVLIPLLLEGNTKGLVCLPPEVVGEGFDVPGGVGDFENSWNNSVDN